MAKNDVASWDTTAGNNTDIAGINIAENCPAAGINNAIRTIMAQVKSAFAVASDLLTGTATALFVTPKSLIDASAWATLTDAATISVDQSTALNFTVTLGGNRTLANMSNKKVGTGGFIRVKQDATGSRTLSWGTDYKFPAALGTPPSLTSAANGVDLFAYIIFDSSTVYVTGAKAFA